jgi:hypothetical protein
VSDIVDDDISPGAGKAEGDRLADARIGARHQRRLINEHLLIGGAREAACVR